MATVINTPGATRSDDGAAAGWAVAAVILLAVVLLGLFVWPGWVRPAATQEATTPGANINVTLPDTSGSQTGGADAGSTGGAQTSPGTGGQSAPAQ